MLDAKVVVRDGRDKKNHLSLTTLLRMIDGSFEEDRMSRERKNNTERQQEQQHNKNLASV